jgi:membrane-associated phospholipid phosphatase
MPLLNYILVSFFLITSANAWDLKDFKTEALSPFSTSARNVFYTGAGLTLSVLIFEDAIVDPTQREFVEDKPVGSLSRFGDLAGQMIPNALYVLGQTIAGANGNKYGYSRALGMLKATAYSSAVTMGLKYTIREPRPNNESSRNSFPSGHATTAFAFGGYIFAEHGWIAGIPALSLATLVGASRINDNRHYLHDVLAGATIGLVYGIGISKLDQNKRASEIEEKSASLTIAPIFDGNTKGIALIKEF